MFLTCTSIEKRKAEVKEWMEVTQGTGPGSLGSRGSKSPWANAMSHHTIAKSIQEQRNAEVKMRRECCHFRSTIVVKTSWRNRPWEVTIDDKLRNLSLLLLIKTKTQQFCETNAVFICMTESHLFSYIFVGNITWPTLGDETCPLWLWPDATGLGGILSKSRQQVSVG